VSRRRSKIYVSHLIAIIASLPMGIGSDVVFIFVANEHYHCHIKNRHRHSTNQIASAQASLKASQPGPSK